jgi:hypothetical protein
MDNCDFRMKVKYEEINSISLGESYVATFGESDSEFDLRLLLDHEEMKRDGIETVLIEANLLNPFDIEEGFELLVYFSSTDVETATNADFRTYYIWDDGQAVQIKVDYKENHNYTILLISEKNA